MKAGQNKYKSATILIYIEESCLLKRKVVSKRLSQKKSNISLSGVLYLPPN